MKGTRIVVTFLNVPVAFCVTYLPEINKLLEYDRMNKYVAVFVGLGKFVQNERRTTFNCDAIWLAWRRELPPAPVALRRHLFTRNMWRQPWLTLRHAI